MSSVQAVALRPIGVLVHQTVALFPVQVVVGGWPKEWGQVVSV